MRAKALSLTLNGGETVSQLASTLGVGGVDGSRAAGITAAAISFPIPNPAHSANTANDNSNSGLRRLPTLGNIKRLTVENQTHRAKIQELERYLWGLKEALIIAREQVHTKDQEAKHAEERKAVEIHELGQHIQRCESNLTTKAVELESLKNQLQHQTKEQISKLKHIRMLEGEIREYRRMSIMSSGDIATATAATATAGDRTSICRPFSTDLTENFRSSMIFGNGMLTTYEEMKQLKEENTQKEDQILEFRATIEKLKADMARLEEKQVATPPLPPPRPPRPPSAAMIFSGTDGFPYVPPPPHAIPPAPSIAIPPVPTSAPPASRFSMLSVGPSIPEEPPKPPSPRKQSVDVTKTQNLKVDVEHLNASRNRNSSSSITAEPVDAKQPASAKSPSTLSPLDTNALAVERSSSTSSNSSMGSTVSGTSTTITAPVESPTSGPLGSSKSMLRYSKDDVALMSPIELS
ncbi:hypothetical protein BGX31_002724 [Mortierella sp. GBA43]|nr:hypothetical protein BGX31_002724 [Mortierella sp. GBA43]